MSKLRNQFAGLGVVAAVLAGAALLQSCAGRDAAQPPPGDPARARVTVGGTTRPAKRGVINASLFLRPADPLSWVGPDNSQALRDIIANLDTNISGTAVINVPAGVYRIDRPVEVDKAYVTIQGQGPGATVFVGNRWNPMFVVAAPGAADLPLSARPVVDSKLDGTVTGRGFSTQGKYLAVGVCNTTTLGRRDARYNWTTAFDYWRTCRQLTFEFAFDGTVNPGDAVWGLNEVFRFYRNGDGQWLLSFLTAPLDDVRPVGTPHSISVHPGPENGTPHKMRIAIDLVTGAFSASDRGADMTPDLMGSSFADTYLYPNFEAAPFYLGHIFDTTPRSASVPSLNFYGFRVSNAYKSEPVSNRDADRYLNLGLADPTVVWHLPLTTAPGRWVPVQGGQVADGQITSLTVVDASTPLQGLERFALRDLSARFAAPAVLMGQTLNTEISRCELRDGATAVESLRVGAAYPLKVTECVLAGVDSGLSVHSTLAFLRDTDVFNFQGPTAVRATLSSLNWDTGHVWFCGPNTHTIVSILGGDYGGPHRIRGILVDDEDDFVHVRRALVFCRKHTNNATNLTIDTFTAASGKTTDAVALELQGDASVVTGLAGRASVEAKNMVIVGVGAAVRTRGRGWAGTVDGATLSTRSVDTDSLSSVTVTGPALP